MAEGAAGGGGDDGGSWGEKAREERASLRLAEPLLQPSPPETWGRDRRWREKSGL